MTRYISFGLLLVTIIFLSILFYKVMAGFLIPLFLAALLVVIFRPLHAWILKRVKGRQKTAAMLTTASVLLLVLAPLALLFVLAIAEARDVVKGVNADTLMEQVEQVRSDWELEIPGELPTIETKFENLTQEPFDEDIAIGHKSDLAMIRANSLDLIKKFKPEFDPASLPTPPTDNWSIYWQSHLELTKYHQQLTEKNNAGELSADDPLHSFDGYRERLANTIHDLHTAKISQFGHPKLWLIHRLDSLNERQSDLGENKNRNPTENDLTDNEKLLNYLKNHVVSWTSSIGTFLGQMVLGTAIMIISLYFFLLDGPGMIESFKGLSPLEDAHEEELVVEFGNVSRAVIVATLLSALAQGILGGIGYYFAGLDSIFLLTLLTGCLAMVPFVGAAAVWIPCCLYLFFVDGNVAAAIGLAIYGAAVISMADNFIKPMVLHGTSNLHPLLALLSVLGGVTALGPIGILIGPMIVTFLQTLLKILQRELSTMDSDANESASAAAS